MATLMMRYIFYSEEKGSGDEGEEEEGKKKKKKKKGEKEEKGKKTKKAPVSGNNIFILILKYSKLKVILLFTLHISQLLTRCLY